MSISATPLLAALVAVTILFAAQDSIASAGNSMAADVVVVGAHAAGLGAALAAASRGLRVILVSDEATPGGMLTAGQIGFVDGSPSFSWDEQLNEPVAEGSVGPETSWATTGGEWRTLRATIAQTVPGATMRATLRLEPEVTAHAVAAMLAHYPNLKVLPSTHPIDATVEHGRVTSVDVQGAWTGRLTAPYWVDGSDAGELVGLLHLPEAIGTQTPAASAGDGIVMSYAYRWTAIESDIAGAYPTTAPPDYAQNLSDYRAATSHAWPSYQAAFNIPDGATYWTHPFRLFNNQGRLSGAPGDPIGDAVTGAPVPGQPTQVWDVNNGANDAGAVEINRMLASDDTLAAEFTSAGVADPYRGTPPALEWSHIAWVEDRSAIPDSLRADVVASIRDAVKDRALGFLWYIRSGALQARLRQLPGGANLLVRSDWSIDNQLGTADGMPELTYEREGRRIISKRVETIYDLCPTYAVDIERADHRCQSAPRYFADGVVVDDYPAILHQTGTTPPQYLILPRPHQLSFRALVPRHITNLLVGGAIGTDRLAYGSFRVDPVRLMIGTAIGEAVAEAHVDHVARFQDIDVEALRERLAEDHQETFFVRGAPMLSRSGTGWEFDRAGTAIQKLIARGWLKPNWNAIPEAAAELIPPRALLDESTTSDLDREVLASRTSPCRLPWTESGATWNHRRPARVADAYIWLAAQPYPDHEMCGATR